MTTFSVSPGWCPELKGAAELLLKCFRWLLLGRGVVTWESVSQTLFFGFLASSCTVLILWISKTSLSLVVTPAFPSGFSWFLPSSTKRIKFCGMAVLLGVGQRGPLYVKVDGTSHLVSLGLRYWIGKTFGLDDLKLSYSMGKMSLKERKM